MMWEDNLEKYKEELRDRYEGFRIALSLLNKIPNASIIETGTMRTPGNYLDGCSTLIFALYAYENKGTFVTVDNLQSAIIAAMNGVPEEYHKSTYFITLDSVEFLANLEARPDLVYLDSYDYDETNPAPSQEHCFHEVEAMFNLDMMPNILMIDDADLKGGGKPGKANVFLEDIGWQKIHHSKQCIWIPKNKDHA